MGVMSLLHGLQRWRTLLFVHWTVPVEVLRPLVPSWLDIDTYGNPPTAYVGLIPFEVRELRPARVLPLRIRFLETNLRTYVTFRGVPGVWFFSLEAASTLAVVGARASFGLPYFRADMHCRRDGGHLLYSSGRRWPQPLPASLDMAWDVGALMPLPVPGSLEHFLVERYVLYAEHPVLGRVEGRVRHTPYRLREARVTRLVESIRAAAKLPGDGARTPDWFCEGVDVEIFPPRRLGAGD